MPGTMADLPSIDGYVADSPYPSNFHQSFQPPWTDWNLERRGLAAPRAAGAPFVYVDLGCGDGLGLILTAAAHPQGRFVGVDAMPEHVARGCELIAAANLGNVSLHCADFAAAGELAKGDADYVAAQGVLAWISEPNRAALLDLAARWLKPGGAFTVGYNCYPGWAQVAGFQRLIRALAQTTEGSSTDRFAAALEHLRAAGAFPDALWEWIDSQRKRFAPAYFAHEYLNQYWNPCWSGDVIAAMAGRGLDFAGQAAAVRLREDLCYQAEWRDALAAMPDAAARELAADLLAESWYRQDIYLKRPFDRLAPGAIADRVLGRWWMLAVNPAEDNEYRGATPAGEIAFDNAAARAIVARLSDGPAPLSAVSGFAPADLINSVDALYAARWVIPVDPPQPDDAARRLNRLLRGRGNPIGGLATADGAVGIDVESASEPGDRRRIGLDG